jgi:hypothetical protein
VAERVAQFWGDPEAKARLILLAELVGRATPAENGWVLERHGLDGKLRVKDAPEFCESFKMMTAEEIAGLDCSEIFPAKLKDAVELLEEYAFFKL